MSSHPLVLISLRQREDGGSIVNTGKLGSNRNRNPVPEMGESPREEEVVLGKGSRMTPSVLGWRGLSKRSWGWSLKQGSKGFRSRGNVCSSQATATPFLRISPGRGVGSAVPFLSQRLTPCPCPHSSIGSLPRHLLHPTSYPPGHFLSPSLPAQVTNTCSSAHCFLYHPPPWDCLVP